MGIVNLVLIIGSGLFLASCTSDPGLQAGPATPAQPSDQFTVAGRLQPNPMRADATAIYFSPSPTWRWFATQGSTTVGSDGVIDVDLPPTSLIMWEPETGYFGSEDHVSDLQSACRDDPSITFWMLGYGFDLIVNTEGGLITDQRSFEDYLAGCEADPGNCGFIARGEGAPPVFVGDYGDVWFPTLRDGFDVLDDPAFSQPYSLVQYRYAPRDLVFRSTCARSGFDVDLRSGWNTIILEWDMNRFLVRSAHPTARQPWQFFPFPVAPF